MPKKKDWGEATRRSDRLTTSIEPAEPTQSEEPAEPAERITETEADQDDHAMESSDKNVLQGLTPQQVNDLLALLAQSQTEGRQATREVTPAESAFGGDNFTPKGIAAHRAFTPYGADQHAPNSGYNAKAKRT